MTDIDLSRHGDPDALAAAAADFIAAAAREAILRQGRFTLVLTGGSTPEATYRCLAQPARAAAIDWSRTFLFTGDERFVPETEPRSNFGMARRALIDHVAIPAANVLPMPTSCASPAEGARLYGEELGRFFNQHPGTLPAPRFDLVLLGLGDDGHVASLFPGMPSLDITDAWVTWSPPGRLPPPVDRITLTLPMINAARAVLFLVSGAKKAQTVKVVLEGPADHRQMPATAVRPVSGSLHWFVDQAAASLLTLCAGAAEEGRE